MNNEDKFNLYDQVVGTTFVNIYSLSKDNNKIILEKFNYNCGVSRVFLEVAFMVSQFTGKEVYISTSIMDYLKIKYKYRKNKIRFAKATEKGIDIYSVAAHQAIEMGQTSDIYDEIFKTYYERKK